MESGNFEVNVLYKSGINKFQWQTKKDILQCNPDYMIAKAAPPTEYEWFVSVESNISIDFFTQWAYFLDQTFDLSSK